MKQQTLSAALTFSGRGLHTGREITLTLHPAAVNTGYRICRSDLENRPEVPALADYVTSTERATKLSKGEVEVMTIEHVFSALYALGVDNCLLEVNGPEMPLLNGSALPFAEEITRIGLTEQDAEREYFVIKKRMEVSDPETGARIVMLPDEQFAVDVHFMSDSPLLSNQFAGWEEGADYLTEIAPARTFVFLRDLLPLMEKGLIQGGSLNNALVIYDKEVAPEVLAKLDTQLSPLAQMTPPAYLNPSKTLGLDEPARHKLLDILGDLALTGKFIKGRIIAYRPGHGINNQAARLIQKAIGQTKNQAPLYDPDKAPIMDVLEVKRLLPHRYPFLMVDKVIEMGSDYVVGIKSVSGNEPFFEGHFPAEPVMPGVLIVEAMAQTGGLLVLNQMGENCSTYFLTIDKVKFRQKVVPGDTLIFKLNMTSEIRRGVANMRGLAFVGSRLVCEAEFMAQIIKN